MFTRYRAFVPVSVLALFISYFAVHALTGDRGLLAWSARNALLEQRRAELAQARAKRADLEARVRLLREGSLSADLLEERARSLLGFSDPRDYVIRMQP